MIIGGFAAGVRILLEKGPSRHHISKIRKIPEKYQKNIFYQKTRGGPKNLSKPGRVARQLKKFSEKYSIIWTK
jgi:hypothetical protein